MKVERNTEMIDFNETPNGVTSTLRRQDGGNENVESLWLAGCDGAHSTVRHKLGKEFQGETYRHVGTRRYALQGLRRAAGN